MQSNRKFVPRLRTLLATWHTMPMGKAREDHRAQSLALCDEIHLFEEQGGDLSPQEDRLWEQLSYMVEESKKMHGHPY